MKRTLELCRAWGAIVAVGVVLCFCAVLAAQAQTITLSYKHFQSLLLDGDAFTAASNYAQVLGAVDSAGNVQALSVGTDGVLDVDVSAGGAADTELPAAAALADNTANPTVPAVGAFLMTWDGTTWDRIPTSAVLAGVPRVSIAGGGGDVAVTPAIDDDSGRNALYAAAQLEGFDGTDYDRLRVSNDGDAVDVGDGTDDGLLIVLADLLAWNGTTHDRVDSVDTGALVTEVCDSGSGSTLCADVETAGADDLANTENGLLSYANLQGFDGTTWDRLRSYAGNADSVTSPTLGSLGVTGFNFVYDLGGANWDRLSTGHMLGAGVPGAAVTLGVDGTSSCATALAVGYHRITPVAAGQTVAYCCVSGTSCTAVTTDTPYYDGQYYVEAVTDAATNDVRCCITGAAGTNVLNLFWTPLTF